MGKTNRKVATTNSKKTNRKKKKESKTRCICTSNSLNDFKYTTCSTYIWTNGNAWKRIKLNASED